MNVGTTNENPPENTLQLWLSPCTCAQGRYHCNARLKEHLLRSKEHPYQSNPLTTANRNLIIQFIELKYCN